MVLSMSTVVYHQVNPNCHGECEAYMQDQVRNTTYRACQKNSETREDVPAVTARPMTSLSVRFVQHARRFTCRRSSTATSPQSQKERQTGRVLLQSIHSHYLICHLRKCKKKFCTSPFDPGVHAPRKKKPQTP